MTDKTLQKEAMEMLKQTSRTFYIPITMLGSTLRNAVASAYLCMRAIDEIEDHEKLPSDVKEKLLLSTSKLLKVDFDEVAYQELVKPYEGDLPEVTLRLGDWIKFCPENMVKRMMEATQTMAKGMAKWVKKNWNIQTKEDLDDYTYFVAGLVGVMLSDMWEWHSHIQTDRDLAIGYGRGLQAVNILRNQEEDFSERGVNFFPNDWGRDEMFNYARENLALADEYMKDITKRRISLFCKIPLALAKRTLKTMESGKEKMSRTEVHEVVDEITKE